MATGHPRQWCKQHPSGQGAIQLEQGWGGGEGTLAVLKGTSLINVRVVIIPCMPTEGFSNSWTGSCQSGQRGMAWGEPLTSGKLLIHLWMCLRWAKYRHTPKICGRQGIFREHNTLCKTSYIGDTKLPTNTEAGKLQIMGGIINWHLVSLSDQSLELHTLFTQNDIFRSEFMLDSLLLYVWKDMLM